MKSTALAYVLWFFLGVFGIHRFYTRNYVTGVIWFFTCGLFGLGWFFDLFITAGLVRCANIEWRQNQIEINAMIRRGY